MTTMTHLQSALLGILQGLGEFLPISSSAHLVIAPRLFGWEYQGLVYDVMLHLGTLLALLVYFAGDWSKIIRSGLARPSTYEGKMLWLIIFATMPAAAAGYFFEDAAEHIFRAPELIAFNLIIFAAVLYQADKKPRKTLVHSSLNLMDAAVIGLAQALAIFPGVSRAGITITAALWLGYRRDEAAKISFLLAGPIIIGATIFEARKLSLFLIDGPFITGFFCSVIASWLAIKFLLSYLKTRTVVVFVVYRIILGAVILGSLFYY